jgi:hypothetical protein
MMYLIVMPCAISTLAISFLISPVKAKQDEDAGATFTDNLFSDLAPLLVLPTRYNYPWVSEALM